MLDVSTLTGTEEKIAVCKDLGADFCINYRTEDFVARVKEETAGKGIHSVSCFSHDAVSYINIEPTSVGSL